ncbi:cytochrome c biogenesis CcdA family protein [Actinocorallia populi]|uniref:cytochrome c biogenesis CcdA family protein n=1 Tax=Actinocorallia populi TaxID=2079200 RepID=UPI000D090E16|nr:cytochrome c biogenesis protein CcdA [Actinocorallia populi]
MILAAGVEETITSGTLALALPLAALAGMVSFLSPCVLPLVPGYLSYVTGMTGEDLAERRRGGLVTGVALFVLGFTLVFMAYGFVFGGLGHWLKSYEEVITRVLGVVTIGMGLLFMGFFVNLQRTFKSARLPDPGLAGAPLLGLLFGLGWTPCIGPTLTAIQSLALYEATPVRGGVLSFFYCLGLGLPFLLTALAYRKALTVFGWVKRHYRLVMRLGGGMLVLIGVLLVTGLWTELNNELRVWIGSFGTVI